MTLTAPKEDSPVVNFTLIGNGTTSHPHHVSKQILGYIALLGSTFCSVSTCDCHTQHDCMVAYGSVIVHTYIGMTCVCILKYYASHISFQALYLILQKRLIFNNQYSKYCITSYLRHTHQANSCSSTASIHNVLLNISMQISGRNILFTSQRIVTALGHYLWVWAAYATLLCLENIQSSNYLKM